MNHLCICCIYLVFFGDFSIYYVAVLHVDSSGDLFLHGFWRFVWLSGKTMNNPFHWKHTKRGKLHSNPMHGWSVRTLWSCAIFWNRRAPYDNGLNITQDNKYPCRRKEKSVVNIFYTFCILYFLIDLEHAKLNSYNSIVLRNFYHFVMWLLVIL